MSRLQYYLKERKLSSYATTTNARANGSVQPLQGSNVVNSLDGLSEMTVFLFEEDAKLLRHGDVFAVETDGIVSEEVIINPIQYFRITDIQNETSKISTVKAQNVTYDLSHYAIKPFTLSPNNSTYTIGYLNTQLIAQNAEVHFTEDGADHVAGNFKLLQPMSARAIMGGYEGSLKDVYRCDYVSLSNTVLCYPNNTAGSDRNFRIAYGKNLVSYKHSVNYESVCYSVLGYANINDVVTVGNLYTKVEADDPRTKIVDFSEKYSEENPPTIESLTSDAESYATSNQIEKPRVNFDIDFIRLSETEEYKGMLSDPIFLGDTVHITLPNVEGEILARVLKTTYDLVQDRFSKIEVGNYRPDFYNSIVSVIDGKMKR